MAPNNYVVFVVLLVLPLAGMQNRPAISPWGLSAKPDLANLLNYFNISGMYAPIIEQTTQKWYNNNAMQFDYTISKPLLQPYFEKLGLTKELEPSHAQYQHIVVVGDFYRNTQKILQHLEAVMQANVQSERIVLLSSDRVLEPFEKIELFNQRDIATEADMLRHMYSLLLSTNTSLAKIPHQLIKALDVHKDATTDPIVAKKITYWLDKIKPVPGKCLLISEQPYALIKKKIMELYVPMAFEVDVTATQAESSVSALVFLHAVACHIQFDMRHPYNNGSFFIKHPCNSDSLLK